MCVLRDVLMDCIEMAIQFVNYVIRGSALLVQEVLLTVQDAVSLKYLVLAMALVIVLKTVP